jgi:pyrroline-5-carboxylate reductase
MKLTFLGSGNIARAIIGGLVANGTDAGDITAADPMQAALTEVAKLGVATTTDNRLAVESADVILLSVKPNIVKDLSLEIAPYIGTRLVISVAAGITATSLAGWLGNQVPIIRCMPNTPALYQQGITGLYAGSGVDSGQRQAAETVLSAVGSFIWVSEESEMNAVTAVSGSGPAYFFYVMEAMQNAAVSLGLSEETASKLVLGTALGAAQMASADPETPEVLRRRVTSPGGTTEAALNVLIEQDLEGTFGKAIRSANQRSIELARSADD